MREELLRAGYVESNRAAEQLERALAQRDYLIQRQLGFLRCVSGAFFLSVERGVFVSWVADLRCQPRKRSAGICGCVCAEALIRSESRRRSKNGGLTAGFLDELRAMLGLLGGPTSDDTHFAEALVEGAVEARAKVEPLLRCRPVAEAPPTQRLCGQCYGCGWR
jgi:hypothetical protein